jgi:hypothetical protein
MPVMRARVLLLLLVPVLGCGGSPGSDAPAPASGAGGGGSGSSLLGCTVFPADNAWNQDVSQLPVDSQSDAYIASMNGGSAFLHPDFGSDPTFGIPWTSVPGSQPLVPMEFDDAEESDTGPYPFPPSAPVESGDDRHVLVLDSDRCRLYETFDSHFVGPGWHCFSGAVFDLHSDALRPNGFTSADAAGLPILPGLVRRDEVLSGAIHHALRFTVRRTQAAFVHPATHFASSSTDPNLPPMGLRVRLKSGYDLSLFHGNSKVILQALKTYGMFVADNGSDWFITGETNTSWDDSDLEQIKSVPGNAFEVVQHPPLLSP